MASKKFHLLHSLKTHWKMDLIIIIVTGIIVIGGSIYITTTRSFQLFGDSVTRVNTQEKVVALTFDDGPRDEYIDDVLSTLDTYHVKATFFLIGKEIDKHPGAARKIVQHGHEVGNHSYTHRSLVLLPPSTIAHEVELTDLTIREIGYKGPIYFRPPYGHKFIVLPWYLAQHHRTTILWSIAPDDDPKNDSAADMSDNVLRDIKPGSIIILHVMEKHRQKQRDALKLFIPALQKQGYTFVTVDQLLSRR